MATGCGYIIFIAVTLVILICLAVTASDKDCIIEFAFSLKRNPLYSVPQHERAPWLSTLLSRSVRAGRNFPLYTSLFSTWCRRLFKKDLSFVGNFYLVERLEDYQILHSISSLKSADITSNNIMIWKLPQHWNIFYIQQIPIAEKGTKNESKFFTSY